MAVYCYAPPTYDLLKSMTQAVDQCFQKLHVWDLTRDFA